MKKNLEELKSCFERFKKISFPEDSDDSQSSQLHAELIEYDGFIAGLISRVIDGEMISIKDFESGYELKSRLEKIANDKNAPGAKDAKIYLNYLEEIIKLIDIIRGQQSEKY
jgi:hypothetical protein